MDKKQLEKLEKKTGYGGKRKGAGRKPGKLNKATLERKVIEDAMKQRIMQRVDTLLNSQFALADGISHLYVIRYEIGPKGGKRKLPAEIVTDPGTIKDYLDGNLDNSDDEYYFITTKAPDNKAIDSLLDRTFGKATQPIAGENGNPLQIKIINYAGHTDSA